MSRPPTWTATTAYYVDALGAELVWKVRGMGTTVARLRLATAGPAVLLSGHLDGTVPILIFRVADYAASVSTLRTNGVADIKELEIPHGPCASFTATGGQRIGFYELVRADVDEHFSGRIDD